jgi:rhodanese-related sulfurtransferase
LIDVSIEVVHILSGAARRNALIQTTLMQTISAPELAHWLADGARTPPLVLDVREPWEHQVCAIAGAALLPMSEVRARVASLATDRPVVCVCHHGARSAQVAMFLRQQGWSEVYNLTGGIDAWARQVDPTMAVY